MTINPGAAIADATERSAKPIPRASSLFARLEPNSTLPDPRARGLWSKPLPEPQSPIAYILAISALVLAAAALLAGTDSLIRRARRMESPV